MNPSFRRFACLSVKWMAGIALAIPAAAFPLAAADLVYSGSALLGTGEYGLTERTTGFTFLNGLSLQVHSFRVSATIPLSGQSTALVSTTGAGIISSGGSSGSGTTSDDRPDRTGSGDDGIFSVFGVGDPSVRLDFDAIRSRGRIPSVSFFGQMKIPVADPADGLGTGEFDYSTGLSLAFPSGRNLILAEAAWWILGEMPDAELENPVSLNASLGRSFAGGRTMASLIFSGCTRIVPDTEPPMQAGAGFNILAGGGRAFGLSAMFGLTDSASDVSVSAGWTIPID